MIIDVTIPQLGESISEGTITKWLVREGDFVEKDQFIFEVATDKADQEIPAPVAGRVVKLLASEGDVVPLQKVAVCQIEEGASAVREVPPAPVSRPTPASVRGPVPAAPVSRPAPASVRAVQPPPPMTGSRSATGGPLATPTARQAALRNAVDLDVLRGSGDHGRITRDDVLRAATLEPEDLEPELSVTMAEASPASPQVTRPQQPGPQVTRPQQPGPQVTAPQQLAQLVNQGGGFVPPIPGVGYGAFKVPPYRHVEGDKIVPFTRRRRITADHMTYSKFASPHVVTVAEVDLHRTSRLREANKERYKKDGASLTMLAFVVAATARALREHPAVNARVLEDAFVQFKDIHLGVAVDSPEGLVVPVVRRADELGVRGIVRAVDELAKRARSGKITADDLSGATFSITNPGLKGNLFGGAIISQPNVGILRMGEIQKRVVVLEEDGEDRMVIHPVMFMALSYDHRIVDGVLANSFLWRVTELLERGEFEV